MFFNDPYNINGYQYVNNPYYMQPRGPYNRYYYDYYNRQQPIRGQATWTEGGQETKCGIPWSQNRYMTAAVGKNSPYECRQTIKVRNPQTGRELLLTVVDEVSGYPQNKINLHRRAFEALGANTAQGVIDVEIIANPELEQQKWGKYLLELTQLAYPDYNIREYNFIRETQVSPTQTQETYEYTLQSQQERIKVRGNVVYNPNTDRIVSFDISEV
ncbi:rare lipoprotein A [Virgibacillus subterraneus]|uniref:Rare lipoprotein A n=2 Tax=Virgibacillus TaxID=84406 RepID=A0A1H1BZN2_9BACI|nr:MULTISPECIES: DUF3889 domain-containing protein [Virgibacillus]SDQ57385.1 rare lipoprotein A [Virgibacillus salinus]SEQ54281.1 rare lipoprotein A [Virgibacillus subterraneus]